MKYKIGDIIIFESFKTKIVRIINSNNCYEIHTFFNNQTYTQVVQSEYVDRCSKIDIKSMRKEKLKNLNEI